jgi:hypothetical protein
VETEYLGICLNGHRSYERLIHWHEDYSPNACRRCGALVRLVEMLPPPCYGNSLSTGGSSSSRLVT